MTEGASYFLPLTLDFVQVSQDWLLLLPARLSPLQPPHSARREELATFSVPIFASSIEPLKVVTKAAQASER